MLKEGLGEEFCTAEGTSSRSPSRGDGEAKNTLNGYIVGGGGFSGKADFARVKCTKRGSLQNDYPNDPPAE